MKKRVGWVTLKEHFDALRAADQRALAIKETADLAALELARQIQTYKDEKANELREQINSERGLYATKTDLAQAVDKVEALIKPQQDYVRLQTGQTKGIGMATGTIITIISALASVTSIVSLAIVLAN